MNQILQSIYRIRINTIQSLIKVNIPKEPLKDIKLPCGVLKYDNELSICKKIPQIEQDKVNEKERIVNC